MTPTDIVNLQGIFDLQIEGREARARGPAVYRAMMGQSDAVKVAMLKHRPHQRPVNHRTTIASPSVRWRGAPGLACRRIFPPRSRAHESRRLQRRDARPHPAPPRVLPPLRLEASRCARLIVYPSFEDAGGVIRIPNTKRMLRVGYVTPHFGAPCGGACARCLSA